MAERYVIDLTRRKASLLKDGVPEETAGKTLPGGLYEEDPDDDGFDYDEDDYDYDEDGYDYDEDGFDDDADYGEEDFDEDLGESMDGGISFRRKPAARKKNAVRQPARRPVAKKRPELPSLTPGGIALILAKIVCIALIAVFLVRQTGTDKLSSTPYETVEAAVSGAAALDTMQPGDNLMVKRLYGIDPNAYEGVFFYYPTSNMGAEEVLLVKYSGDAQKEEIRAAMEKRLASQLDVFEGYGVDQTAMLGKAIIEVRGGYALFVSADDPGVVRDAFLAAL